MILSNVSACGNFLPKVEKIDQTDTKDIIHLPDDHIQPDFP